MAEAGIAQFDSTLISLRVVTVAVNLRCDARRPSLCLEALTLRNELSDVSTDSHSDKRIRGPFAGGATSWKSGFAYEAYEARKREQDKPTTELATAWSLRTLARQLVVNHEDLFTLLKDPRYDMPRMDLIPVNTEQDLEVLRSVKVQWTRVPEHRRSDIRKPMAEATMDPMPYANRPVPTPAPEQHRRESYVSTSSQPLQFRKMLVDGRDADRMLHYLARLHQALLAD